MSERPRPVHALALEAIQSEVLFGYNRCPEIDRAPAHAAYLLLRFARGPGAITKDSERARAILRAVPVTWADAFRPDVARVNVGMTHRGLRLLLPDLPVELERAPAIEELADTLAGRARVLGDVGPSRCDNWCFSDGVAAADGLSQLDAVIMVFGPTAASVCERVDALADLLRGHGVTVRVELACALEDDREHFGYVDGISQPAFEGIPGPVEGYGTVSSDGSWRRLRLGELVLGYPDEEQSFAGPSVLEHGSFFVLRKLEQDIRGFHELLRGESARMGITADDLAARLMGRGFDGTPLLPGGESRNAFRYAADSDGFGCPFGAHIRRANPRDTSGRVGDRSERHRMVRRGLTYVEDKTGVWVPTSRSRGDRVRFGEPISDEEAGELRWGLMFGCFVSSVARQFEIVQGGWLNGGETSPRRLFTHDPVAGTHLTPAHFTVPGRPPMVARGVRQFTTTRGGAYFFVPGGRAWRTLTGAARPHRAALPAPSAHASVDRSDRHSMPTDTYRTPGGSLIAPTLLRGPQASRAWFGGGVGSGRSWLQREVVPEAQVLMMLAPVQAGRQNDVERLLTRVSSLDGVFSKIRSASPQQARTIRHARFCLTPHFCEFDDDQDPLRDEPAPVALPNGGEPYLFFGCWFDGSLEELAEGLVAGERELPFAHCAGYPRRADSAAVCRFIGQHRIPLLFAYNAYTAPTHVIARALTVRRRFVELVADISATLDAATRIDAFFERLGSSRRRPPKRQS